MTTKKKSSASEKAPALRISPQDILQMYRERWLLGLIVGLAAAIVFFVLQPKQFPTYRTEASLLFETRKDRVLPIQDVVDTQVQTVNELNTHLEQLRSQTFFDYAIASFTPAEAKRIQEAYRDPEQKDAPLPAVADIIRSGYYVYARKGTMIVTIGISNRDPEIAAMIANRIARRYIDFNLDRANTGTNSAIVFLRNQAEDMRNQVEAAENAMQAYRAKNNIAILGQTQSVVLQKVSSVGNELVKAQMEQVETHSLLEKIEDYQARGKDLLEIAAVISYGQVASHAAQLADLRAQRGFLEQRYLKEHPKMKDNAVQMQEATKLLADNIAMAIASLQTRLNVAKQYESRLRSELDEAQKNVHDLDRVSIEYKLLEQEAETKRATYSRIVDRLNEANVTSQLENVNIKLFDPAFVPGFPAGSPFLIACLESAGLGVFLFLVLPLIFGFIDTRVKTVANVEQGLGQVLLGAVKNIRGLGETERAHAFRLHKDGALEESYRGIYSEIDIRSTSPIPKIVAITSTMPGDGKSLTASNLAAAFAAHGRRTVLIDCDLRRPTLHRIYGASGSKGWTQWAQSPLPPEQKGKPATIAVAENLELLPAGGMAKNPTETLDRLASSGLLKLLTAHYDIVMLDTPPVAVFPDALLLCRHCQELIYVCKFGAVRLSVVRRTLQRLRETGVTVLGLILNQMPETKLHTYGYQGYGSQRTDYYDAYAKTSATS
jgi:capsular exopolysaccharide synthesis family protein